jgi:acyl dehydratase
MLGAMEDKLYLEDLTVGQRFVSGTRTLTAEEMIGFAERYDPQPFHVDERQAEASLFGGLVASGWHTAVTSMQLMVQGGLPLAGGVIGTGGELLWTNPVRPGDTLHVECEVLEIMPSKSKPDRGTVVVRCTTRNARGETVQSFTPKLVVLRRPR